MMQYNFAELNTNYAGGYQLGGSHGLRIQIGKRPLWLHRKMMEWCLGWEWIDN